MALEDSKGVKSWVEFAQLGLELVAFDEHVAHDDRAEATNEPSSKCGADADVFLVRIPKSLIGKQAALFVGYVLVVSRGTARPQTNAVMALAAQFSVQGKEREPYRKTGRTSQGAPPS